MALEVLPAGIGGIALAAGVAAMMSTASGGLIAAATVLQADVIPLLKGMSEKRGPRKLSPMEVVKVADASAARAEQAEEDVNINRRWVLIFGVLVLFIAMAVPDVVAALTIAYDILVGGLLVAIIGGLVWKRGTGAGATWAMVTGSLGTLVTMGILELLAENRFDGVFANEPIYVGLALSAVTYIGVSLATKPTDPEVLAAWLKRTKEGAPSLEQVEEDARDIEMEFAEEI